MRLRNTISALIISSVLMSGAAYAQNHDDNHDNQNHDTQKYVRHTEWHKGAKINQNDWNRGTQVDWNAHHLQAPPSGYEWREVDGNYVLAAVATGLIATTILASTR